LGSGRLSRRHLRRGRTAPAIASPFLTAYRAMQLVNVSLQMVLPVVDVVQQPEAQSVFNVHPHSQALSRQYVLNPEGQLSFSHW
jgi:hypothetical protein